MLADKEPIQYYARFFVAALLRMTLFNLMCFKEGTNMRNPLGISRSPLHGSLEMTFLEINMPIHVISRSGGSEAPKVTRNPCDESINSSGIYGRGNLFVSRDRALMSSILSISWPPLHGSLEMTTKRIIGDNKKSSLSLKSLEGGPKSLSRLARAKDHLSEDRCYNVLERLTVVEVVVHTHSAAN